MFVVLGIAVRLGDLRQYPAPRLFGYLLRSLHALTLLLIMRAV